jgi:hypothetical protein
MPGDGEQVTEVLHFWFAESLPRQIWLMPLMHKEDLAVQEVALPLFERFSDPRTAYFARSHRDVIAHVGRFPHRNAALGGGLQLASASWARMVPRLMAPSGRGRGGSLGA